MGYRTSRGGFGTVAAIVIQQPIEISQAIDSNTNRNL